MNRSHVPKKVITLICAAAMTVGPVGRTSPVRAGPATCADLVVLLQYQIASVDEVAERLSMIQDHCAKLAADFGRDVGRTGHVRGKGGDQAALNACNRRQQATDRELDRRQRQASRLERVVQQKCGDGEAMPRSSDDDAAGAALLGGILGGIAGAAAGGAFGQSHPRPPGGGRRPPVSPSPGGRCPGGRCP